MNTPTTDSAYVQMNTLKFASESLQATLKMTNGMPIMSDEDMKLSIVILETALAKQMLINEDLIARVQELEKKKFKLRFWKN